jgi:phage gpG-like protein
VAGVNDLIRKLERFSSGEVYERMGRKIADACHAQAIAGFRAETDPYGVPWAPRKKVSGWAAMAFGHIDNGHPLLDDTGAMINSLTVRYSRGTVLMRIKGYAKFHQSGTRVMASRKIFPVESQGLGTWSDPIQQAATDAIRELMR